MRVRLIPAAGRLITLAVLVAACATPTSRGGMAGRLTAVLDSIAADSSRLAGPRVAISTDNDVGRDSRVVTRLRVEEDAYVAVVNVSPSGYASVVFPDSPDEPALLRGGRTYVIPSQFTGYHLAASPLGSAGTRFVWYGRSATARPSTRGPGYLFVIASRAPLNLAALEEEGYFDDVDVGGSVDEMEPGEVIPRVAVVASTGAGIAADYARYSGYSAVAYASSMFHSSYNSYCLNANGMYMQSAFWQDAAFGRGWCDPVGYQRNRTLRPPVVIVPPTTPGDTTADSTGTDGSSKWRRLPFPAATSVLADRELHPAGAPGIAPVNADDVVLTREERRRTFAAARAEAREAAAIDAGSPRMRGEATGRARAWDRPDRPGMRPDADETRSRVRDADAPRRADPVDAPRREPRRAEPTRVDRQEPRAPESRSTESRPASSRPTEPMQRRGGGDPGGSDPSRR